MSNTRSSYQEGSLDRVSRAKGSDVWVFRWRELSPAGCRIQKKKTIGNIARLPSLADAKRAVENFRAEINAAREIFGMMTVSQAWDHFQTHELRDPEVGRSETTIENYLVMFKSIVLPKWRDHALTQVKAVDVERWLRLLPHAPASKAKAKSLMSSLFSHCIRHELCQVNPILAVRQSAKRLRKPDVLTIEEMRNIFAHIANPAIRVAAIMAAATGLRRSELCGLKWEDIDFENSWMTPQRGRVRKMNTRLKTEASRASVPLHEDLASVLLRWRDESCYKNECDWVFASPQTSGRTPYWMDSALKRQIRPAAMKAGITKEVGWHTFRRSLATVLAAKKIDIKTVQELLRHANSRITLDVYTQGNTDAKRAAQEHMGGLFVVSKAS